MPNLRAQSRKSSRNNFSIDDIAVKLRNKKIRSDSDSKSDSPPSQSSSKILNDAQANDCCTLQPDDRKLCDETGTNNPASTNRKKRLRFSKNDSFVDCNSIQSKSSNVLPEDKESLQKQKLPSQNFNLKDENELRKSKCSSEKDKQKDKNELNKSKHSSDKDRQKDENELNTSKCFTDKDKQLSSEKSKAVLKPCSVVLMRSTADIHPLQPKRTETSPNAHEKENGEKMKAESLKAKYSFRSKILSNNLEKSNTNSSKRNYSFHSNKLSDNSHFVSKIDSTKRGLIQASDNVEYALRQSASENENDEKSNTTQKKKYSFRSKNPSDKSHSEVSDSVEYASKQSADENENDEKSNTTSQKKKYFFRSKNSSNKSHSEVSDSVEYASTQSASENENDEKSNTTPKKKYSFRSKNSSNKSHSEVSDSVEYASTQSASENENDEKSNTTSRKKKYSFRSKNSSNKSYSEVSDSVEYASTQSASENENDEKSNTASQKKKYSFRSKNSSNKSHSEVSDSVDYASTQSASENENDEKSNTTSRKKKYSFRSKNSSNKSHFEVSDSVDYASTQSASENENDEKSNTTSRKKKYSFRSKNSSNKSHSEVSDSVDYASTLSASENENDETSNTTSQKKKYSFRSKNSSNKSHSEVSDSVDYASTQSASENENDEKSNTSSRKKKYSFRSKNSSNKSHSEVSDSVDYASTLSASENENDETSNTASGKKYSFRSKNSSNKSHSDISHEKLFSKEMLDAVECDSTENESDKKPNTASSKKKSFRSKKPVDKTHSSSERNSSREFSNESFDGVEYASRQNTNENDAKSNTASSKKYSFRSKDSSNKSHSSSDVILGREFLKESLDRKKCDSRHNTSESESESDKKGNAVSSKKKYFFRSKNLHDSSLTGIDLGKKEFSKMSSRVEYDSKESTSEKESFVKSSTVSSKKYSFRSRKLSNTPHSLSESDSEAKNVSDDSMVGVECDSRRSVSADESDENSNVASLEKKSSPSKILSGRSHILPKNSSEKSELRGELFSRESSKDFAVKSDEAKKTRVGHNKLTENLKRDNTKNIDAVLSDDSVSELPSNTQPVITDPYNQDSKKNQCFPADKYYGSEEKSTIPRSIPDCKPQKEDSPQLFETKENDVCLKPCQVLLNKVDHASLGIESPVKSKKAGESSLNVSARTKLSEEHKNSQRDEEALKVIYSEVMLCDQSEGFEGDQTEPVKRVVRKRSLAEKDNISLNNSSPQYIIDDNTLESRKSTEDVGSPVRKRRKTVEIRESSPKFVDDPKMHQAAKNENAFSKKGIKTKASVENDDFFQKMEDAVIQKPCKLENDSDSPRKSRRNKLQRDGALVDDIKNKCSEPLKVTETDDIVPSKLDTLRGEKICQELQESEKTDDDFSENLKMKFKTVDKQEFENANDDDDVPKKKSLNYSVRNKFSDELIPTPKYKIDSPKTIPRNRLEFGRKPDLGVLKKGGKLSSSEGSPEHDSSERGELFQNFVPCPPTSDWGTPRPSTPSSSDCETQRPSTSGYKKPKPSTSFGETFTPKEKSQQLSLPQWFEFMIRNDDSEHSSDEISIVQNNVDNLKSPENQGIVLDERPLRNENDDSSSDVNDENYESAYETASESNSSDQHDLYDVPGPSNASPYSPGTPSCSYASYDPMDIDQPSTSKESEPHVRNKLSDHFRSLRPIKSPSDCNEIHRFRTRNGEPYKVDFFEHEKIKKMFVHLSEKKQRVVTCLRCRKKKRRKPKTVSAKFYKLGVYNLPKEKKDPSQNPDSSSSDSDNENCDPIVPPIVPTVSTSSESGYHSHEKFAHDYDSNEYEADSDDSVVEKTRRSREISSEPGLESLSHVSMDLDPTFCANLYSNYRCPHCGEKFLNRDENYRHICNGKPVPGFQCIFCEKIFPTFEQKEKHRKKVHKLDHD